MIKNIVIEGIVVHGEGRGKGLGFPTANLDYDGPMPKHGVYVSIVILNGQEYMALTNVGCAKTFGATVPKVEPHILDFDEDIYGQTLTVILIQWLRDMIKFPSENETH